MIKGLSCNYLYLADTVKTEEYVLFNKRVLPTKYQVWWEDCGRSYLDKDLK